MFLSRTCCSAIPHKNSRQSSIQKRCALRLLLISKAIIGRGLRLRRNATEKSWSTSVLCPIEGIKQLTGNVFRRLLDSKNALSSSNGGDQLFVLPPLPPKIQRIRPPVVFSRFECVLDSYESIFGAKRPKIILTWNSENSSKKLKNPNLSHVSGRPRRIYVRRCPETQNQSFGRRWHFFYSFCESV